eukprot:2407813-Heterocapsa_arctica.AAC.1
MESAGELVLLLCLWRLMPWPGREKANVRGKEARLRPVRAKTRARARLTMPRFGASDVVYLVIDKLRV